MQKILALTRYDFLGASSRVRFALYQTALENAGYHMEYSPFFDDDYLRSLYDQRDAGRMMGAVRAYVRRLAALFKLRRYDLLWIEKELLPFAPAAMERLLTISGVPYVVDYDDAIFHNYDQHSNSLVRRMLGSRLDGLMAHSSGVTAGNRYLGDYAQQHGAGHVVEFPTVVDTTKYRPFRCDGVTGPLTLGWIGSPATKRLLVNAIPALNQAFRYTPFRLLTIGIDALHHVEFEVEVHPWAESTEVALLNKIDIGIMPLADTPFERGKCGYKLIQYMACGKPVIASPVGVNSDIVSPDIGFLANEASEWVQAIAKLGNDPNLRHQMGQLGRRKVEGCYSLCSNIPKLIELFDAICDKHAKKP